MEVKNLLFVSFEYFCSVCDLDHSGGVGAAEAKGDFCHKNGVIGQPEITKSPIHRSFCVISVTPKEGWAQ
jgi:hypothetical protein